MILKRLEVLEKNGRRNGIASYLCNYMSELGLKGPNQKERKIDFSRYNCEFYFTEEGFEKIGKKLLTRAISCELKVEIKETNLKEENRKVFLLDEHQVAFVLSDKEKRTEYSWE